MPVKPESERLRPPTSGSFQPGNQVQKKRNFNLTRARSHAANSALETCRTGGPDPIKVQIDAMRSLYALAARMQAQHPDAFENPTHAKNKPIIEEFRKVLKESADIAGHVAEFAYPKWHRIHHLGDAPSAPVSQKVVVTLNIGSERSLREGDLTDDEGGVTIEHEADPDGGSVPGDFVAAAE